MYESDPQLSTDCRPGWTWGDCMFSYNKHMPNQTLCSYTLFSPGLRPVNGDKFRALIWSVIKYCALVIEIGRWRWSRRQPLLLASVRARMETNSSTWVMLVSVSQCKYSAQCLGCYMWCHVCIAWHWHIVTLCGNSPSWYVTKPSAGKGCNSRDLLQDSVMPISVFILGINAGDPTLRCEVNV